jgi:hypothetical protein
MCKLSWLIPAVVLSAALLTPAISRADDVTYQVNLQLGDGTITGTITTNGGTGGKNFIEIDSFSFGVTQDTSTGSVASGGKEGSVPSVNEINVGNDLTADATHLYFNFGNNDGGYLALDSTTPNAALQYICFGALVPPCIFSDPEGIAVTNLNGNGIADFQPETGNMVIGTVIPSPEPATTSLLLLGTLFSLLLVRRNRFPDFL